MTELPDPSSFPPGRLPDDAAAPERALVELPDGYQTVAYVCSPRGASAQLPILYLHGVQSHPAWFVGSASYLAERGHPVYLVTRRGSGENRRDRGHARSATQLLADVEAGCRFVLKQTGAGRLHLMGVSWGGKLLAAFAAGTVLRGRRTVAPRGKLGTAPGFRDGNRGQSLVFADCIASLTLIAPGIVPRVDIRHWTKLAVGAAALLCPRRQFDIPLGEPALFTDSEPMQRYIAQDELSLRRATARFLLASRMLDCAIARAPYGAIGVPTHLVLSSRDRIIDSGATADVVRRLTADRCAVTTLEGAHTLEFEADPSAFYEALAGGLQANSP